MGTHAHNSSSYIYLFFSTRINKIDKINSQWLFWWRYFVQHTHYIIWCNETLKKNFIRPIRKIHFLTNSFNLVMRKWKKKKIIKLQWNIFSNFFFFLTSNILFSLICSASSAQLSPAVVTNAMTKPTPPPPGSISTGMPLPPPPSLSIHSSTPTSHSSFPPPLFATPLPPSSSSATVTTSAATIPHPFSAESLFQTSKGMCQFFPTDQKNIKFFISIIASTKLIFPFLVWNQFQCCAVMCVCVCVIKQNKI